ncbi:Glutathione S-transferase, N-terminal [Dillenia turbinata]|uniref:glutathione transferase n=1 Tax=Dillenia turbinata TaxID=194707 RepID=A0AAN8UMV1_9MAGN
MAEEVKLFKTWSSPYGLRAVWALKLKGIEYESIDEDHDNKSPQLLQYNPVHKKIPVLIHNGKPVAESLVIVEYIDETWKQNPILPQDPYECATACFWAKFGDEKVLPSIWRVFIQEGKAQEELLGQAMENLKFLEEQLEGKVFFGGEKIGLVDIALGWIANLTCMLEEISGLKLITQEKFPLLFGWMQNFVCTVFVCLNPKPTERPRQLGGLQALDY